MGVVSDVLLDGRVALVTGGSRGIGLGIARALRENGARLAIGDIDAVAATDAASVLGSSSLGLHLDVRYQESIEAAAQLVEHEVGPIDILVNNAGVLSMAPALELAETDWDHVMAVNAKGVFLCSQVVGRGMVKRGWGRIVNISSIAAKTPFANQVHYCASKAAVLGITRVFALELAKSGVTVNAVCPGSVDTRLFEDCYTWNARRRGVSPEAVRDRWLEGVAIGRLIDPIEIGSVVAFLSSDKAAAITGQAYNVDGGTLWS
jgi:NAD(P)-dependent dehydrogenase (short-subunit alcohol dehydrogenase family)